MVAVVLHAVVDAAALATEVAVVAQEVFFMRLRWRDEIANICQAGSVVTAVDEAVVAVAATEEEVEAEAAVLLVGAEVLVVVESLAQRYRAQIQQEDGNRD